MGDGVARRPVVGDEARAVTIFDGVTASAEARWNALCSSGA